jgi:hypothetical protein
MASLCCALSVSDLDPCRVIAAARHRPSDRADIGMGRVRFEHKPAIEHHDDAVRELKDLVEILANQQHGGTQSS